MTSFSPHSILTAIGNTPMVEIGRLNPSRNVKIFAKLESSNPGGSIKDRIALQMILDAEASGELTPDKAVIEATSGNTGIGLAMICASKGYRLILTMSEAASMERRKILNAMGAEILLTPGHLGTDGAIEEVYRLVRENPDQYFLTDQFNNPSNWKAHYYGTAEEIWQQTEGDITCLVAVMGTTGTLMGCARRLIELNPNIMIVGVEPYLGHKIQGLKNMKEAYCPEIYEKTRLTRKVNIDDEDAYEMARQLARQEGLFVGMSSGAAMKVAADMANEMTDGVIVTLFPDGGERYLSTPLFTVRTKAQLHFFNTLARNKAPFTPRQPGKVSIYTCGPTAYTRMHLGQCRRYIFADLLCRYLEFRDFTVHHVINITDYDDKTIAGAEAAKMSLEAFTQQHIDAFKADLTTLRIRPAEKYARASEHIADMTVLAKTLVDKGVAYEKLRSLYFDISKSTNYGCLSGVDIHKIRVGATVDLDDYEKENPRDFTLFKRATLSELKRGMYTQTEWGNVRPSWHIQCAAISRKFLPDGIDIHTGGRELLFPHHDNQIAIHKAATGTPTTRFWLHCDTVTTGGKTMEKKCLLDGKVCDKAIQSDPKIQECHIDGEKCSRSNPIDDCRTLDDLLHKGYTAEEIRFWLISTHYRKPLIFDDTMLASSRRGLQRINQCIESLHALAGSQFGRQTPDSGPDMASHPEIDQIIYDIRHGFVTAMDDDLNISAGLAAIFSSVKRINKLLMVNAFCMQDAEKLLDMFKKIDKVLQIFPLAHQDHDADVAELLAKRNNARQAKDWQLADSIREELRNRNVMVRDDKIVTGQ